MIKKTLISIAFGVAIGLSPLRNSSLVNILITLTGVSILDLIAISIFSGGRTPSSCN